VSGKDSREATAVLPIAETHAARRFCQACYNIELA
jgi:hypothetical protein